MNIACSTTVFSQRPLEEALSRISALGFSFVDLLMMENWAHINPSELAENHEKPARELSVLLRTYGLKAVAMNTNISGNLSTAEPGVISQNHREADALIGFAKIVKIPIVVFQPGRIEEGDAADQSAGRSVEALNRIVAIAASQGITVAIETHSGSLAEKYQEAMDFVSRVPGLRIAYDPSHFIMAGMDLRDSAVLMPHVSHIHLRNAVRHNFQASMSEGVLDFMWVLEAIDVSEIRGAISIEYLDNRDGDILGDVNELKRMLDSRYSHI